MAVSCHTASRMAAFHHHDGTPAGEDPALRPLSAELYELARLGCANWGPRLAREGLPLLHGLWTVRSRPGYGSTEEGTLAAIRGALDDAIAALVPPWSMAAHAGFGFSDGGDALMRRREKAAAHFNRNERWYRSPNALTGGDTVERHVLTMVSRALIALETIAGTTPREADSQQPASLPEVTRISPIADLARLWGSLPPLSLQSLQTFVAHGLAHELARVLADELYQPFRLLYEHSTFVSSTSPLQLSMEIYDPEDTVYVVSRAADLEGVPTDVDSDQWARYRAALEMFRNEYRGVGNGDEGPSPSINQTRVVVTDGTTSAQKRIEADLAPMHRRGTLLRFPLPALSQYPLLGSLQFGFTVSTRGGFALIPIPRHAPTERLVGGRIPEFVRGLTSHEVSRDRQSMYTIVTSEPTLVRDLIAEFERLTNDHRARALDGGAG